MPETTELLEGHIYQFGYMKRAVIVQIIDVLAFALFVMLTSTGIMLHYVLPPRSGRLLTIWELSRHDWGQVHFWIAVLFFSVLVVHFILHWHFLTQLIRGRKTQGFSLRFALGVVALLSILALGISPFISFYS